MFSGRQSHPGKSQNPRSLGCKRGGNEADETDKAALGTVSESPDRNESEPKGGLDTKEPGGRALFVGAKAAWHDAN